MLPASAVVPACPGALRAPASSRDKQNRPPLLPRRQAHAAAAARPERSAGRTRPALAASTKLASKRPELAQRSLQELLAAPAPLSSGVSAPSPVPSLARACRQTPARGPNPFARAPRPLEGEAAQPLLAAGASSDGSGTEQAQMPGLDSVFLPSGGSLFEQPSIGLLGGPDAQFG